jgi:hypothetical protein
MSFAVGHRLSDEFVVERIVACRRELTTRAFHPDFTQELRRKLLPTRAEGAQRRRRKKREFTRRCLWRLGSSLDLKRAHNPYLKALRLARGFSIAGEPRELLAGAAAGPWMRGPELMRGIGRSWIWGSNTVSSPASSIRFVGAISSPSGGGMMVMAGDVAIKGRASGRPWVIRAYPP